MIRVGVIRGGPSSEYEVSLNTGGNVLQHLRGEQLGHRYKAHDILIDRQGYWHLNGMPTSLEKVYNSVDVIFNALHGDYGEDGKLQQLLELWKIPYTGSGPFASALGYNKALAKERFISLGIKTPKHMLFPAYLEDLDGERDKYAMRKAKEVWNKISPPWIVKPVSGGSSVGIKICKTFPELVLAFSQLVDENVSIIVEEFIQGKEATVGVIDNFRGQRVYTLPPIEIRIPKSNPFFDYEAKYSGVSKEICPGNFSSSEKEQLRHLSALIHTGLNLDHYSRSDFIFNPRSGIYALEVNTLPGLTDQSLVPKALEAVGSSLPEFIHHLINLALSRNR